MRLLSIGIQVRFGDDVIKQDWRGVTASQTVSRAGAYFNCASQLEHKFKTPGQKVVWYLNSDSRELRRAAKEVYGNKLLTDTESSSVHSDCSFMDPSTCNKRSMDLAMQHAIGSMLTFSLTDFQVITHGSGFGRIPAWMTGKWNNLYDMIDNCSNTAQEVSAMHWAGV